jgi:hypothetical protein
MAREMIAQAQTAEQLRQAQAVALPLLFGLSLEQTAEAIGRSRVWTCRLRNRFLAGQTCGDGQRQRRGGRRRNLGGAADQAGVGGAVAADLGAVVGVQRAAPARLAQAGAGQAPSAKRRGGAGRVEKKLPAALAAIDREWAGAGRLMLMFQDEARFGRINDVRRCWAPHPLRPVCQAMLTHEYTYAYAAVDVVTGAMDSLILPYVNTDCMQVFVDEVAARHPERRIVMVLDGAGWHRGQGLKLPANLRLLSLPPYAPELNPVEHVWDELREKFFHNLVFDSLEALENQLECGLRDLESDLPRVRSIVSWPWLNISLLN